jgi:hypothetical protein
MLEQIAQAGRLLAETSPPAAARIRAATAARCAMRCTSPKS